MDAIKTLPAPLRFGIPVAVLLVIGLIVWMTMFKAPPARAVVSTQDVGLFKTAKTLLDSNQIDYTTTDDKGTFSLEVAESDATDAAEALAASGIKDRTGLAKNISCPPAPGFTATKAANERSSNCDDAKRVQAMLLTAGAIAANVSVSQEENGTLLGPEKSKNVVAQVFLPDHMKGKWPAEQAAKAIKGAVGTPLDRVTITDDQLQTLFDGSSSSGGAASSDAAGGSLGCGDIALATEIETKKAAVRSCYEGQIGSKLTDLLGGRDRFVLTVEPTIQSVASTVTKVTNTPGAVVDANSQKSDDSSVTAITKPANTEEQTRIIPAGAISSLRISVTLDKDTVTADQQLAVKRMLSTVIDPRRRDPAPTVTMAKLASDATKTTSSDELEAIKKASTADTSTTTDGTVRTTSEIPPWALALMAALIIGIVTAVLVLWRRSAAMTAERRRLEASFQQEQRLFEDFAQQNPDQLANDLNALFGAPAAPEPTYR